MSAVGIKRWDASYMTRRAHRQCVSHSLRMDRSYSMGGKDGTKEGSICILEEELKRPEDNDSVGKLEAPSW